VSLLYVRIITEQKLPFDLSAEEIHLFRSSANARHLLEAMADIDVGRVVEFDPTI
jgi:PHD/YefM family antitoxin component YafN of YafNO toxin-antitoxin module